jgi:uncharacterized protein (DUF2235 family)
MPKSMIFLFDGTANDASEDRFSNVYAINQLIADRKTVRVRGKNGTKSSIKTQITFYLPGVGTKFTVRKATSLLGRAIRTGEQYIFGDGAEQLILRAYVNLSANYHPGDEIVIIGFSRGAAAARIFSRLVSDFGILSSDMLMHLDQLWNEFVVISKAEKDADYERLIGILQGKLAEKAGKQVFHQPKGMAIKFLGLFDTVSGPVDNEIMKGVNFRDVYPARGVEHIVHLLSMHEVRWEFTLKRFEVPVSPRKTLKTLREIWMPGVHSDVGGGYLENLLSNIALLTMCDKLESLGGVAIDKSTYSKIEAEVASKIRNKRIVINPERLEGPKQKRDAQIHKDDEIHPLHWYLLNKTVIWKSDSPPTTYLDRLGRPFEVKDRTLKSKFDRWVAEKTEPRDKKPRAQQRR